MIKDIDNDIANLYQIKKHLIEKEDKKKGRHDIVFQNIISINYDYGR